MNNKVDYKPSEQLYNAVLGSHLIRNHIPGDTNLISEKFRQFLGSTTLCKVLSHKADVRRIGFSPEGTYIITVAKDTAYLWDTLTGKLLHLLKHNDWIASYRFSPDGNKILTSSGDKTAKLWNVLTGQLIHTLSHDSQLGDVMFSSCGDKILTTSGENLMVKRLWDTLTGKTIRTFDGFASAEFSRDGTKIFTSGYRAPATLWDINNGTVFHTQQGNSEIAQAILNPNGTQVLTRHVNDHTVSLWDTFTGIRTHSLQIPSAITFTSYNPDGTRLFIGAADYTTQLWDTSSGTLVHIFQHGCTIDEAVFSHDGTKVLTFRGGGNRYAYLWNTVTGEFIKEITHTEMFYSARFSPDDSHILIRTDENLLLWNVDENTLVHIFKCSGIFQLSFFFSPHGTQILTQLKKTVELWNMGKPSEVLELLTRPNMNQIELLQAFELVIRERSRILLSTNIKGNQIRETFRTFPVSVQLKLRRFMVQEEKPKSPQSSSSKLLKNLEEQGTSSENQLIH